MRKGGFALTLTLAICACISCGNTQVQTEESKAECVMEVNSRRILYESRGDLRLPMASTTKIVTAITVLESCDNLNESFSIPSEAVGVEGSSVYLKKDEVYTVEELLYGLMLRSGNDCATALALYASGSVANFTAKMNETAQKAGALHSNFENPHGLPSKEHYTTARDLTAIACYAMHNTVFREIVSTKYYEPRHWQNKNKMLFGYEGGIGIKTGYTKEAGRCLVTAAEREGMTLVCSVLSSPQMYERSAKLLDDAFNAYEIVKIVSADDEFFVEGKRAKTNEEFTFPLLEEEKELLEYKITPQIRPDNEELIGQLEILLTKRLLFSTNLYKL